MSHPLSHFRPGERCVINGWVCEIERQARRTTFVRIVEDRPGIETLVGARMQLSRKKLVECAAGKETT